MAILDQPGGNANAELKADVLQRPIKAYQWTCTNPGCPNPNQIGRIEDGCQACGVGKDAIAGQPLAPTDFNCAACKGSGTVERKCGVCEGTGYGDAPQLGEPPPACDKCGGSGSIALGCGRCDGSGIDPAPAIKPVAKAEETSPEPPVTSAVPAVPTPSAGIFIKPALPSIDEEQSAVTSSDRVVRYRLIRYEGSADAIERTFNHSLDGVKVWPNGNTIAAMEIAEPRAAKQRFEEILRLGGGVWPSKDNF